uniref:Germin-like protein n=1 Tax=Oryza punctata TaxID=4537 RepID=A0A0E0KZI1_ORYPU
MAMVGRLLLLLVTLLALAAGHVVVVVVAFDPNPLQDFCVADPTSKVRVNGLPCKDPATVTADDFFFSGVGEPGGRGGGATASRRYGFTAESVDIPGLNTLGASSARVDVAPGGVFPPHYHPRASETAVVLAGAVYFGFVTSYPDNRVVAKVLRRGDVFAVPQGLVHFLYNNGSEPAALYASLSSQNPGLVLVGDALFAAPLPGDLVAKTLLTDEATVDKIRANFIVHRS